MHLVTRLLLRFLLIGILLLIVALATSFFIAQRDIRSEAVAGTQVGKVVAALAQLQNGADIMQQVQSIDTINRDGALRHFHVALYNREGLRLTAQPPQNDRPAVMNWLMATLARDTGIVPFRLPLARADGMLLAAELVPNPYSEAGEKVRGAMVSLMLYVTLTVALLAAIWASVTYALAPLADILAAIARFEAGDFSPRLKPFPSREMDQIGQALNHLASALAEHISAQRHLLHRIEDTQEAERRRLAHELHDEFGQLLTAMQVDCSYLIRQLRGQAALQACAQALYDNTAQIMSQVKGMLMYLRPYGLLGGDGHGIELESAMADLVANWRRRPGPIQFELRVTLSDTPIPQRLALALYRIAQEAITNAVRHAHASRIVLELRADAVHRVVTLAVSDDGIGLTDGYRIDSGKDGLRPNGLGMLGIHERVLAHNGKLLLQPNAQGGLMLQASFTLPATEQAVLDPSSRYIVPT